MQYFDKIIFISISAGLLLPLNGSAIEINSLTQQSGTSQKIQLALRATTAAPSQLIDKTAILNASPRAVPKNQYSKLYESTYGTYSAQ